MTIIICDNHENNTGVNLCEHLQEAISSEIVNFKVYKVCFTHDGNAELEGFLCQLCASSIGVENGELSEPSEQKAEQAFSLSNSISSVNCFKELCTNA